MILNPQKGLDPGSAGILPASSALAEGGPALLRASEDAVPQPR